VKPWRLTVGAALLACAPIAAGVGLAMSHQPPGVISINFYPHGRCEFNLSAREFGGLLDPMSFRQFAWPARVDGTCHADDDPDLMAQAAALYRLWGSGI
jgi:hypothetical protein